MPDSGDTSPPSARTRGSRRDTSAASINDCLLGLEPPPFPTKSVEKLCGTSYGDYLKESEPERALESFNAFRVLYALRRGSSGAQNANKLIEVELARAGAIARNKRFYKGRPVMVTRNDYVQKLFNGDVGITLAASAESSSTSHAEEGCERVCFIAPDGSLRSYAPSWLPPHETVYAMTVHKSQGSEFERVAVVLPENPSPILTRELIYTAVTRAKQEVIIYADAKILSAAVERKLYRQSGLRQRLWLAL